VCRKALLIGSSIATSLFATSSFAEDKATQYGNALNNVHMELAVCTAYFTNVVRCAPAEHQKEVREKTKPVLESMSKSALRIAKTIGLTQDAMASRLLMATEEQTKLMNNSCVNLSSLYTRHGQRCKQLGENPDSVLLEYMKR
jgi:hypothetical protein